MIKNKIAKAAIAATLAVGGVVGVAQSASATSFDCFPGSCSGTYYSTDAYNAARTKGDITWDDPVHGGGVDIDVRLQDTFADGRGPIVYVRYTNEVTGAQETRVRHRTEGVGESRYDIWFDRIVSNSSRIDIQVCNGYGSDGKADYCSGWKGGFHQY